MPLLVIAHSVLTVLSFRVLYHLEPVAIANCITQSDHTRHDHALVCLANLWFWYDAEDMEPDVRQTTIQKSLARRWKAVDQRAYILCLFLNPYLRGRLFNRHHLDPMQLIDLAWDMFERLFEVEPSSDFFTALIDYMHLTKSKDVAERAGTVGLLLSLTRSIVLIIVQDIDQQIWVMRDVEKDPSIICNGRNGVARLARRLMGFTVNSGGPERVCSDFGLVDTKHRDPMYVQTMHRATLVHRHLRRQDALAGYLEPREPRSYATGIFDKPSVPNSMTVEETEPNIRADLRDMAREADEAARVDVEDESEPGDDLDDEDTRIDEASGVMLSSFDAVAAAEARSRRRSKEKKLDISLTDPFIHLSQQHRWRLSYNVIISCGERAQVLLETCPAKLPA